MRIVRLFLVLTVCATAALASAGADPNAVGTWVGTITGKQIDPNTGKASAYKGPISLVINADNSYSLVTPSVSASTAETTLASFGPHSGRINQGCATIAHINLTLTFSDNNVRGTYQESWDDLDNNVTKTIEAKFKAKKQP
jgi:hypothetical protein